MDTPPYYFASALTVAFFIIILNSYVLSLFKRKRNLRSHSNIFLISLTLSDLMTGVIVIPYTVAVGMLNYLPFDEYAGLFIFSDVFVVFSAAITIVNLSAIILDRYLSLCHPFSYSNSHKKGTILKLVFLMWFVALLCSCIRLIWLAPIIKVGANDQAILINATYYDRIYSITGFSLYCVLCLLMFLAFCRMFWSIRKFRTHHMKFITNAKESSATKSEWKAVFVFGCMFGIFLACWSPMVFIRFLDDVGFIIAPPPRIVLQILVFIRFFSSLCDPILYTFYKLDFQLAVKEDKRTISSFISAVHHSRGAKQRLRQTGSDIDEKGCVNSSFHTLSKNPRDPQNASENSGQSRQFSPCSAVSKLNTSYIADVPPALNRNSSTELIAPHADDSLTLRVPNMHPGPSRYLQPSIPGGLGFKIGLTEEGKQDDSDVKEMYLKLGIDEKEDSIPFCTRDEIAKTVTDFPSIRRDLPSTAIRSSSNYDNMSVDNEESTYDNVIQC